MTVKIDKTASELIVAVSGMLDTLTAPQLEEKVNGELAGIKKLVLDFKDLIYISSAGLRILVLFAHAMEEQGEMEIRNASEDIMEIFEVTGFADAFTFV